MKYETKYKALEKLKGLTFDQLLNAWETTEHLNTPETSIVRETKMNQLFTAYYVDRTTVYEKTLDYIYSHEPENLREIRPTIWLWKGDISPLHTPVPLQRLSRRTKVRPLPLQSESFQTRDC